jgi:hypothetical protein
LARLKQRIEASSNASSLQAITHRLSSIEGQYRQLDSALEAMPANASPKAWMELQQRVYIVGENVGLLSKMVDQATSGVKSILQSQV